MKLKISLYFLNIYKKHKLNYKMQDKNKLSNIKDGESNLHTH